MDIVKSLTPVELSTQQGTQNTTKSDLIVQPVAPDKNPQASILQFSYSDDFIQNSTFYLTDDQISELSYGTSNYMLAYANYYLSQNSRIEYVHSKGHDPKFNPLQVPTTKMIQIDNSSFVGWLCYQANINNWTSEDACGNVEDLLNSQKLFTISTGEKTMTITEKSSIIAKATIGDLVFFDTHKKNGSVGIFTGYRNGNYNFIIATGVSNNITRSGIYEFKFTDYWAQRFNGGIRAVIAR